MSQQNNDPAYWAAKEQQAKQNKENALKQQEQKEAQESVEKLKQVVKLLQESMTSVQKEDQKEYVGSSIWIQQQHCINKIIDLIGKERFNEKAEYAKKINAAKGVQNCPQQ